MMSQILNCDWPTCGRLEIIKWSLATISNRTPRTSTSNGKQFTITREILTALARDQRWPGPGFSKAG